MQYTQGAWKYFLRTRKINFRSVMHEYFLFNTILYFYFKILNDTFYF